MTSHVNALFQTKSHAITRIKRVVRLAALASRRLVSSELASLALGMFF